MTSVGRSRGSTRPGYRQIVEELGRDITDFNEAGKDIDACEIVRSVFFVLHAAMGEYPELTDSRYGD